MDKVLMPGEEEPDPPTTEESRKTGRRTRWSWLPVATLVLLTWWWLQYQRVPFDAPPPTSLSQINRLASDLATFHNAETSWADTLAGRLPYSIEVERALVRENGRPIVVIGTIKDIRRRDQGFVVEMEADLSSPLPFLRFSLDCSPGLVERLLAEPQRETRSIAVARIESVTKARFRIDAHGQVIGEDAVETELELETADYFVARGHCIEILPVPHP